MAKPEDTTLAPLPEKPKIDKSNPFVKVNPLDNIDPTDPNPTGETPARESIKGKGAKGVHDPFTPDQKYEGQKDTSKPEEGDNDEEKEVETKEKGDKKSSSPSTKKKRKTPKQRKIEEAAMKVFHSKTVKLKSPRLPKPRRSGGGRRRTWGSSRRGRKGGGILSYMVKKAWDSHLRRKETAEKEDYRAQRDTQRSREREQRTQQKTASKPSPREKMKSKAQNIIDRERAKDVARRWARMYVHKHPIQPIETKEKKGHKEKHQLSPPEFRTHAKARQQAFDARQDAINKKYGLGKYNKEAMRGSIEHKQTTEAPQPKKKIRRRKPRVQEESIILEAARKKLARLSPAPPPTNQPSTWTMREDKVLSPTLKEVTALMQKSHRYGINYDILREVYLRGVNDWWNNHSSENHTPQQWGFSRVNSFLAGGKARELDRDLMTEEGHEHEYAEIYRQMTSREKEIAHQEAKELKRQHPEWDRTRVLIRAVQKTKARMG